MPVDHFRVFSRRPTELPATITSPADGSEQRVRLIDLGLGGACVEMGEAPEEDARLRLSVTAPTLWDPLVLDARVVWTRSADGEGLPDRVGLRFEHGPSQLLDALVELIGTDAYE